ncbi:hypothetical protein YSA_00279 [Pseudomonas putida ND6]|uniref:Uncharacterized protein n=1 Tax=Pseudomonas putida ND6 TaxID=231023 RepID=I3UN52_PSEPU|nr:hypothetical protein YSA_00279 [Pseudomonas putida ND6]
MSIEFFSEGKKGPALGAVELYSSVVSKSTRKGNFK